jgi:hypothetical protein
VSPLVACLCVLLAQVFAAGAAATVPPAALIPPRPRISAVRAAAPPTIDGRLDDRVWATASVSDTFTQHFPEEGAPPSERTEVRILYDDDNLYVGIDCQQTLSPISRRLMRRDAQLPSDGVWFDIDSRQSGVGAFHFAVNAAGVLSDGIHFDDTGWTSDWDAVWEAKVADTGHGYSAEFRIPLATLRFRAAPVQSWGFQARRFIEARQETDDWAFYPRSAVTYVPLFGSIDNLVGLRPRRGVELMPFLLQKVGHRTADAGVLAYGLYADASAGLDAKAHVTNELTLDLTMNPDFGQVEADAAVLNLSTYETQYPEKRPFFLEGFDTFSGLRPLVYTRRIGHRAPVPGLAGETLVDNPQPVTIWGAAKLAGTIGGRTTLGLISALTGPGYVEVQGDDGLRFNHLVDPWTTFNVLRVKRLVASNTDVGVLATAVNRFETPLPAGAVCPVSARPVGPDGRCTNDAYVVSTDGRWRSRGGDYTVAWQAAGTTLRNGPLRLQPDGIPIAPGDVSGSGALVIAKDGGAPWNWGVSQYLSGKEAEFNDLGYLERKHDWQAYSWLSYRKLAPAWKTLESVAKVSLNLRRTLDGLVLWNEAKLAGSVDFVNFWNLYVELRLRGAYYDDRELGVGGDGTALQRPATAGAGFDLTSDARRRLIGEITGGADRRDGGWHFDLTLRGSWRVLPQLELELTPTGSYDSGVPRYISSDAAVGDTIRYHFGDQTAASFGTTLRASYTFTPELSLQLYTQLFLARVHYGPFFSVDHQIGVRDRISIPALGPAEAVPPASDPNPDSEQATLNINLVMRWEYRLGSTLFFVYTRSQNPSLTPSPNGASFEIRPLLHNRGAEDVAMVKLSYWWG